MIQKRSNQNYLNWLPIIHWYDRHARCLPWRASNDPYAIWVSEIMLQQTTVATVIPYFERFMARWPTIHDLAQAPLEDVLHAWQGLGYYRRARWLHQTACIITAQGWPTSVIELQKLPGIGPYTARAIAAIAFRVSALPIDGNIARIMARILGWQGAKATIIKQLEAHDWGIIPKPDIVAQALMDLGQAICKPRQPLCDQCPLQSQCVAPGAQSFDDITAAPRRLYAQALCTTDNNGVLVCEESHVSAPSTELLKGLWGPLMTPWRDEPYPHHSELSLPHTTHTYCGTITHVFSHIRLKVDVFRAPTCNANTTLPLRPFSKLALKIIQCAQKAAYQQA